jgi:hypothetical protein
MAIFRNQPTPRMNSPTLLYFTDGRDVAVTNSSFQVKNVSYPLSGIFGHRVSIVLPHRTPFTVLIFVGAVVFLCGALDFLPAEVSESISLFGFTVVANAMIMVLGICVLLLGMLGVFHLRDTYVVKVLTSSGEKIALASHKREYVDQITEALNLAHLDLMKKPSKQGARK